ncbi:hypothetical protein GCM10023184_29480 [Flaviaesturariibacter amylovorans]|uniref:Uncharacterized protein n=2 Tax=Flaviaesturariibacter amylovorans TaxID=1084520 RepID=A0ABP8H6A8_9BACT
MTWFNIGCVKPGVKSGKYTYDGKSFQLRLSDKQQTSFSGAFKGDALQLFRMSNSNVGKAMMDFLPYGGVGSFKFSDKPLVRTNHLGSINLSSYAFAESIVTAKVVQQRKEPKNDLLDAIRAPTSRYIDPPSTVIHDYRKMQEAAKAEELMRWKQAKSNFFSGLLGVVLSVLFLGSIFTMCTRKRVGCKCEDGTESYATGSGACSWHGGVRYWNHSYWWN